MRLVAPVPIEAILRTECGYQVLLSGSAGSCSTSNDTKESAAN